jgi:hypothetical protein
MWQRTCLKEDWKKKSLPDRPQDIPKAESSFKLIYKSLKISLIGDLKVELGLMEGNGGGRKLLSGLIGSSRFFNKFQLTGFKVGWEGKSDKLKGVEQELNLSSEAFSG